MEDKRPEVAKKIVLEFLDFMKYKVENGLLTMEEIEMLAKTMESNLIVRGTLMTLPVITERLPEMSGTLLIVG